MAQVLNNTISGETSNSYCDAAYADDYWGNHYSSLKASQWAALSAAQKIRLLVDATKIIESARFTVLVRGSAGTLYYNRNTGRVAEFVDFKQPIRLYEFQRLQFPRNVDIYVSDGGGTSEDAGVSPARLFENLDDDTLPQQVTDNSSNTVLRAGDAYIREEVLNAQCEQAMYLLNFDDSAISNRLQGVTMDKLGLGKDQIALTQEFGSNGSMYAPMAFEMLRGLMVRGGRIERA